MPKTDLNDIFINGEDFKFKPPNYNDRKEQRRLLELKAVQDLIMKGAEGTKPTEKQLNWTAKI